MIGNGGLNDPLIVRALEHRTSSGADCLFGGGLREQMSRQSSQP